MGMAFSEVIAYGWLIDELEMSSPILLPFMGVSVKVGPGMLSFGEELQQRRPIAHALDRTHAAVGGGVEVPEDKGWFVRSLVEFLREPAHLLLP